MTSNSPVRPVHESVDAHAAEISADHDVDEEISLLDLLLAIAERKGIVLRVTAFFTVVAIIVSFLLPMRYTATVTLLPPQENSSMAAAMASQLGSLGGMASLAGGSLGLKNPNDRFVAMLQSRTVEDAMVKQFGLMQEYHKRYVSDARKAFESHAIVDGSGKDGLIHISVEDRDPRRAAELANGYVDQFRDLSQHLAITEASQRRLFFQQELEQAKNNLASAEEALEQTEQKTGVIQPDSQERALIESAASLRAQITAREVQIRGMQTYATGENSELVQAQQELAGLRAQLAKLGGSEDTASNEFMIPKGLVPKVGMEYVRRLRDVKYYETIFDILARQFEMAKLDEAKEGAVVQVVDPPIPPDRRSFPQRALIVLGGAIAGFILGLVTAVLQASWKRIQQDPESSTKIEQLRLQLFSRRKPRETGSPV
jgi:uncharacterized protein involved in exopolysaccharide biosynthesis